MCSLDFEYLKEVPVLTLDVDDDFKDNKVKCADMIEKVQHTQTHTSVCYHRRSVELSYVKYDKVKYVFTCKNLFKSECRHHLLTLIMTFLRPYIYHPEHVLSASLCCFSNVAELKLCLMMRVQYRDHYVL